MKKYSQLYESFITKYLFWNRIQEIMKAFCHESLELYGSYIMYVVAMLYSYNYVVCDKWNLV